MPRTADHDERCAQICSGVRRSAAEVGLVAVTMSSTARAAGVSVGLVQHYYSSKDALLVDTLDRTLASILDRVERATALAEARGARIEHVLCAGIEQLLPLDEVRTEEARLRMAFSGLALDNPRLREHQTRFVRSLRARVARAVENAGRCGEIPDITATEPTTEAHALLSLADGLCLHILTSTATREAARARTVVATRMSDLFPGTCTRHVASTS